MAFPYAGLVLRAKSVEAFQAQRSLSGANITAITSVPIDQPESQTHVVQAIRVALAQARIKPGKIGVSLAGSEMLLRSFTLPSLPRSEWRSAVQFEARKHIPFRPEELVWDFHVTEQRAARQLDVMFVGMRAETFAKIHEWLAAAGITPSFVESQSISLARLAPRAKGKEGQFAGLVDLETESAHIVIARDQVPYFTPDVQLGAVPTLGAPGQPIEPGLGKGPGGLALASVAGSTVMPAGTASSQAPDPRAETLLSELRLSLDFFTRENPSASVSQLWLFGAEPMVSAWAPWLSRQLGCAVGPGVIPEAKGAKPVSLPFGCAAGLAMRSQPGTKVRVDVLARATPSAEAAKTTGWLDALRHGKVEGTLGKPEAKPVMIQVIAMLVVLAILKGMANQRLVVARQEQARIIAEFPDAGWGLKAKNQVELLAMQDEARRRLAFLQQTIQQRVSATEKLNALAKALPDGIWLDGLTFNNHMDAEQMSNQAQMVIQGACYLNNPEQELAAISDFAERLRHSQEFFADFESARVGEIVSAVDTVSQAAYKTFRLDCGLGRR